MNSRLEKQINFIMEVDKLKNIFRQNIITESRRNENDAEHSWHLALMAPLLAEYIKEDVDVLKVIKMVIIHDLVEIDAGDTYAYDYKGYEDKRERELRAANRIFNLLPKDQGEEVFSLWNEFEEVNTIEAKYAACLDRLQPILLNYNTEGESWIKHGVHRNQVEKRMEIIKKTSPELWNIVEKILDEAEKKGYIK